MDKLLVNKIITPDGTVLESRSVHDYVAHTDANGEEYMVDGGLEYIRRNINKIPAKDCTCTIDDPISRIRKHLSWGSYGKKGDEPLHYILLCDMETPHIKDVLCQCETYLSDRMKRIFHDELEYRRRGSG